MQETQTRTNEKNCEKNELFSEQISGSNLQSLVIAGKCRGIYIGKVERRFTGNHVLVVKHDGTVLLHSASKGILPVCYVAQATSVSIDRDLFDAELEFNAKNADGERIQAVFRQVFAMSGVPEKRVPNVVRAVLECVAENDGRLGRKRIASIITGSSSKAVLGMQIEHLRNFGRVYGRSRKEVMAVIDELLVQGYLVILVDNEFSTLSLTRKGRDVLETGEFKGEGILSVLSADTWPKFTELEREAVKHLRKWRRDEACQKDVPPYFIMEDDCILDLAMKKPSTMDELMMVRGIGRKRAESFGPQLLYLLDWIGVTGDNRPVGA